MKDIAQINKYPNSEGFTLENKISISELNQFKKFINAQWYEKINQINPGIYSNKYQSKGGNQPPKKRIVDIELIRIMFPYSPKKNKPKDIDEYSTL